MINEGSLARDGMAIENHSLAFIKLSMALLLAMFANKSGVVLAILGLLGNYYYYASYKSKRLSGQSDPPYDLSVQTSLRTILIR